ncbi:hypothetical protein [Roseimaritima ulvae]|nr:hypothetical protein [Roseimaritima ulvae]
MESPAPSPLIEIGIIVAGVLDDVDERATSMATKTAKAFLQECFPEFRFELFVVRRPELVETGVVQPSVLLQQAVEDRDAQHWDFSLVLTAADLDSIYTAHCLAALSRPLDAAVLSLALIDPVAVGETVDEASRVQRVAHRLSRLMLHSLAHLAGLSSSDEANNLMLHPDDAGDLDAMQSLNDEQLEQQRSSFSEVADLRLEEANSRGHRISTPVFALRAGWINRREIVEAIAAARPWQFPRRLSGLTLASVSTVVVLLMTAEAWDWALSQSCVSLTVSTIAAWLLTTGYVIVRQQLLLHHGRRLSEQTVVTIASAIGIVLFGMIVMWASLMLIGVTISSTLFNASLIASWAASSELTAADVGFVLKLRMCAMSASLGLLIGALGASFESQHYFRHVIFVDEEV